MTFTQVKPVRMHAAPLAQPYRQPLRLQRTCLQLRIVGSSHLRPPHRTSQPLVCRAGSQQRTAESQPLHFGREDSSVIDVTPHSAVELDVMPAAAPEAELAAGDSSQPHWWQLGRRFAQGAAVFALALALALAPLSGSAWAASSGGRMGGSSFSAARSYGGSGSFSGGLSGGSAMSRGYSGGGYSRGSSAPSLTTVPRTSLSFGGYGGPFSGYGGYGYGAPVVSTGGGGGGGLFSLLVLGVLAFAAFQILPGLGGGGTDESGYGRLTVAKVQVGLTGTARSLQRELERIAKRADTNSPEGLHFVLQETVLSLLRHPEYCIYGGASTKGVSGLDAAEERFNSASMAERGKFQEETLSNVGGRTRNTSGSGRYSGNRASSGDELIVVTILVAAEGDLKIPNINSREQLRATLNKLGGLRTDQVMALEVLWTPQDDGDYFDRDDLMTDYPKLNTL